MNKKCIKNVIKNVINININIGLMSSINPFLFSLSLYQE